MIHLIDIDENNWRTELDVSESQKHHVSNCTAILARAYAYRHSRSRAFLVCNDDVPVGMGLYYDCDEINSYVFSQLFIDERYQGNGYGIAAAKLVIEIMKNEHKYNKVCLCYIEGNTAAKNLYEKLGFIEVDQDDDEIGMELEFN